LFSITPCLNFSGNEGVCKPLVCSHAVIPTGHHPKPSSVFTTWKSFYTTNKKKDKTSQPAPSPAWGN